MRWFIAYTVAAFLAFGGYYANAQETTPAAPVCVTQEKLLKDAAVIGVTLVDTYEGERLKELWPLLPPPPPQLVVLTASADLFVSESSNSAMLVFYSREGCAVTKLGPVNLQKMNIWLRRTSA